ncbi:MAG: hypothetical protein ACLFVR_16330 [Thiohalospira sp.]
MFFSCEKEDVSPDPVDEGIITLAELDGYWAFQYYEYEGDQFGCYTDDDGSMYDEISSTLTFDWNINIDKMEVVTHNHCYDVVRTTDFYKDYNSIKIRNLNFTILSYSNEILKLRFDEKEYYDFDYLRGILVLKKE